MVQEDDADPPLEKRILVINPAIKNTNFDNYKTTTGKDSNAVEACENNCRVNRMIIYKYERSYYLLIRSKATESKQKLLEIGLEMASQLGKATQRLLVRLFTSPQEYRTNPAEASCLSQGRSFLHTGQRFTGWTG
jgi:hypothetical protein